MDNCDVALVINNLGSGGAQRVLVTLANSWADAGRHVCVISIDGTEEDFFQLSPGVKRIVLNIRESSLPIPMVNGVYMTLKRIILIRKAIKGLSPKSVVAFLGQVNILVLFSTIGLRSKVIVSERNDPSMQSLGFGWDHLRRLMYRFADIVSANTTGALESLSAYVPQEKLLYVPNPLPLAVKRRYSEASTQILAVGSLRPQKAYDVLLQACAIVFTQEVDWSLTVVGDGELRKELQELGRELGIDSKVSWEGRVNSESYYADSGIFVLPSRFEGTPNSLLEAIVNGLPVIVSDASPGPLEYVSNEQTGLVVPVEDSMALADAILRMIRDRTLRHRLSGAAIDRLEVNKPVHVDGVWDAALERR